MSTTEEIIAAIVANVNDHWHRRIDHATFNARQRDAWVRAALAGVGAAVRDGLRDAFERDIDDAQR